MQTQTQNPSANSAIIATTRAAQACADPVYRVRATESIEDLFRLTESVETGDFTDAFLD